MLLSSSPSYVAGRPRWIRSTKATACSSSCHFMSQRDNRIDDGSWENSRPVSGIERRQRRDMRQPKVTARPPRTGSYRCRSTSIYHNARRYLDGGNDHSDAYRERDDSNKFNLPSVIGRSFRDEIIPSIQLELAKVSPHDHPSKVKKNITMVLLMGVSGGADSVGLLHSFVDLVRSGEKSNHTRHECVDQAHLSGWHSDIPKHRRRQRHSLRPACYTF